ncbi:CMD domain protein [Serinibacter salmoneus]|uniref:CMD domain protein n=1 Tax=Serinibacter salmoneus TaxID=556530 RepID=A0A2A9D2T5_9MICO|nr:CMD domain protein [Serinibacter salmoneus]PFG20159.1 CMD domain protein [Serinibacter salmoneus]
MSAEVSETEVSGVEVTDVDVTEADVIDAAVGIRAGDALDAVRRGRATAREQSQAAHEALFAPQPSGEHSGDEKGSVSARVRHAVALFVLGLHGTAGEPLAAAHREALAAADGDLIAAVEAAVAAASRPGPYGVYAEVGLQGENEPGEVFRSQDAGLTEQLGAPLAAAIDHAALLVLRPREAAPADLARLTGAGWDTTAIVTLSQLVSFLTYQVRIVAGLTVLQETSSKETHT